MKQRIKTATQTSEAFVERKDAQRSERDLPPCGQGEGYRACADAAAEAHRAAEEL